MFMYVHNYSVSSAVTYSKWWIWGFVQGLRKSRRAQGKEDTDAKVVSGQ